MIDLLSANPLLLLFLIAAIGHPLGRLTIKGFSLGIAAVLFTGLAFGVTSATALFGGITPWAAQALIAATGWALAPGAMIAVVAAVILPVLWYIPETAPGVARRGLPEPAQLAKPG